MCAFLLGGMGDVAMAVDVPPAGSPVPNGGVQTAGNGNVGTQGDATGQAQPSKPVAQDPSGIATETGGRDNGDPDFYLNDVDKKIVKIRPMSTPIDQISRYASTSHTDSFVCKYYSVGTREIVTQVSTGGSAGFTSGTQAALECDNPSIFTIDDTIRVCGVPASNVQKADGSVVSYAGKTNVPDLVLVVSGINDSGKVCVHAVNGTIVGDQPIGFATIPAGTTLVRMGKACGELDAQTGRFETTPTAEVQYCQNFMMQVEQSFLDKIAAKEVNWGFTDLEEDAIYDMRLTQEQSFLFGDLSYIKHNSKSNMAQWTTKGIWWMPEKTLEVGTAGEITEEDLIDLAKDIFVGAGTGNKKKILLCGSDLMAAFAKVKSDKFKLVSTFEKWHLKFTSWETSFGTLNLIHHELFNLNEMAGYGLVLDPEYLKKRKHLDWTRTLLDLKKAGVRNTQAAVLQEISCLYLRYPRAHARIKLAGWTPTA